MAARKSLSFATIATQLAERVSDARTTQRLVKAHAPAYRAALAAIAPVTRLGRTYAGASAYEWCGKAELSLGVTLTVKVESLRESAELARALVAAESVPGLEARESHDYASASFAQRVYRYEGSIAGVRVTLRVEAELESDGPGCRKVATTKMVEQTEWQIVCDEA